MNQKKSIALTTTFVGLVCGFVLTQQQATAAATNTPNSTTTNMVAPQSTISANASNQTAEPTHNEQPVNQQISTQKAVINKDNVSETFNQNQTAVTQTSESHTTATAEQTTTVNNNTTNSTQPQQETAVQNAAANSDVVFSH